MNKGIALATGDIIGTINAVDFYADDEALYRIAKVFNEQDTSILYGELDYIDPNEKVIRKWRSGKYKKGMYKGDGCHLIQHFIAGKKYSKILVFSGRITACCR